jgi:hypothetical protein
MNKISNGKLIKATYTTNYLSERHQVYILLDVFYIPVLFFPSIETRRIYKNNPRPFTSYIEENIVIYKTNEIFSKAIYYTNLSYSIFYKKDKEKKEVIVDTNSFLVDEEHIFIEKIESRFLGHNNYVVNGVTLQLVIK